MNSRLDDLERLAKLHEQGALSAGEYEREKAALLSSELTAVDAGAPEDAASLGGATARAAQLAALLAILIGAGYFLFDLYANPAVPKAQAAQATAVLPRCDSREARQLIADAYENGPQAKLVNVRVLDVTGIAERTYDSKKPERVCAADVELNTGTEHIGFTIGYTSTGDYILKPVADPGPPRPAEVDAPAITADEAPEDDASTDTIFIRVNPEDRSQDASFIAAFEADSDPRVEGCRATGNEEQLGFKLLIEVECRAAVPQPTLEEFGLEEGDRYGEARQVIIRGSSFRPLALPASTNGATCSTFGKLCAAFPEVFWCSGAGVNDCVFVFRSEDDQRVLYVTTQGEPVDDPGSEIGIRKLNWAPPADMKVLGLSR